MKDYKLVLFDFDNTLYEGRRFALRLVLANLLRALRCKSERAARKALAGADCQTEAELRRSLFSLMGDVATVSRWYDERYLPSMVDILRRHYSAREGAEAMIGSMLSRGVRVGVLSDYPMVSERMAAIGLTDKRIECWSMEQFGALKPCGRPFVEVARRVGVEPGDVLMVGDRSDTDGLGARNAGMDCLLVEGKRATNSMGIEVLPWAEIVKRLS